MRSEDVSRAIHTAVWGVLMIWTGLALLVRIGWAGGLLGAGLILLLAQAARLYVRVQVDGVGLAAGVVLAVCGVSSMAGVAVDVWPVLFIVAGAALLVSTWTGSRTGRAHGGPSELHPRV